MCYTIACPPPFKVGNFCDVLGAIFIEEENRESRIVLVVEVDDFRKSHGAIARRNGATCNSHDGDG